MLAYVIGNVDSNSAGAICVISICLCIIITSMIVKRRSRLDANHDFELAKIKQHDQHVENMAGSEAKWTYETSKLQQNLITSHKEA